MGNVRAPLERIYYPLQGRKGHVWKNSFTNIYVFQLSFLFLPLSLSGVLSKGCAEWEGWDKRYISIATIYIEMTALLENLEEEEEWK